MITRGGVLLAGRPQDYLTYRVVAPLQTHWRAATCAEFECEAYGRGWVTIVPSDSEQAAYIRTASGRRFTERVGDDRLVTFTFEPGQRCFRAADHRVALGRPPLYLVRHGVNGASVPLRSHSGPDAWVDDCRSHMQRIAKQAE